MRNAANETSRKLAPSVGHEEVDVIHAVNKQGLDTGRKSEKKNDAVAPVEPGDSIVVGAGVEGHLEAGQLHEVDVEGLAEVLLLGPRQNVRQLVQASDQLGQTVQLGSCSPQKRDKRQG